MTDVTVQDALNVFAVLVRGLVGNFPLDAVLGEVAESDGEPATLEERGFSQPDELGLVRIPEIDGWVEKLRELNYPESLLDDVPEWHLTDWWNPDEGDALELLNDVPGLSQKAKYLLNINLNRDFFIPLGEPVPWNYTANALKPPPDWNGWATLDSIKPPNSPVMNIIETGDKKVPYKPDAWGPSLPKTYLWSRNIRAGTAAYHVASWRNYLESKVGKGVF